MSVKQSIINIILYNSQTQKSINMKLQSPGGSPPDPLEEAVSMESAMDHKASKSHKASMPAKTENRFGSAVTQNERSSAPAST